MKTIMKFMVLATIGLTCSKFSSLAQSASETGMSRRDTGPTVATPHLTPETRFLNKNVNFSTLENHPVSEGIFALPEYNRKYGSGMYYGFWTIDGKCLFEPRYEMMGSRPVFDHGAVVVKSLRNEKGVQNAMILYADGSARELPESYRKVSQFHDGIATVETGGIGTKKAEYFCIDTQGRKKWPALGPGDILEVGYLRDGLRRVKVRTEPSRFRYVTRWGFIDDKGRWAIKPLLKDVREFRNGYALVIDENEKLKFIDTKGSTVYEFPGTFGSLQYTSEISDISDGCFLWKSTFYDLAGTELKKYYRACGFTDGYAFAQDDIDGYIYVINRRFERIRDIHGSNLLSGNVKLEANIPLFGEAKLATIDKRIVVTPKGEIKILGPTWPAQIGNFQPGEYAPCEIEFTNPLTRKKHDYLGYINRRGEFEVVICREPEARGPWTKLPPGPEPIKPPSDTIPKIYLPPVDTIPEGPKTVRQHKYSVTVNAVPSEGGRVAGGGEFFYGDTVTIGARANEGWYLSDISCDNRFARTESVNRFVVLGDLNIDVHFLKEDDVKPMRSGTYSGVIEFRPNGERSVQAYSVPVYLETSETSVLETPYGPSTGGFLAVMINPEEKIIDKSIDLETGKERGTFSMNVFFVPMKIKGQVEENGRKYLLLDGGELKINNLHMLSSGGGKTADVSALESVMVNLMLMFDDIDSSVAGASYRVEMTDIDESTGAFTFGMMERIDPQLGWIPAGSKVFANVDRGFFVTKVETGLPAGYFNGIRMEPCEKRNDIIWAPGAGFFENNPTRAEEYAKELGKSLRSFQSEHEMFRGVDFRDVGTAFDRIMKMK